jgi:hypothetical protein
MPPFKITKCKAFPLVGLKFSLSQTEVSRVISPAKEYIAPNRINAYTEYLPECKITAFFDKPGIRKL